MNALENNLKPALLIDTGEEYIRCEIFRMNGTDKEDFISLQRKYSLEGVLTEKRV